MAGLELPINLDEFIKKHLTLSNVLNHRHINYTVDEIKVLVSNAILLFESEPKLPRMSPSVVIVGDIHGQYFDLLRMFAFFTTEKGHGSARQKYMFLGDYVDRGKRSLECICLCLALKLRFPKQYILLRGNHETRAINHIYGFHDEMLQRYPEDGETLWTYINEMFSFMPLAGMVGKKILCMHGGISKDLNSLEDIEKLPRPLDEPNLINLAMDLLWADPMAALEGFSPNTVRGVSTFFGEDTVAEVCQKLNIDLIVRAHQMLMSGYGFFANRKLVTVFTAPRYQADAPNKGAVLVVNKDGRISFRVLAPEGEFCGKVVPEGEKSTSCVQSSGPGVTPELVAAAAKNVAKPVFQ